MRHIFFGEVLRWQQGRPFLTDLRDEGDSENAVIVQIGEDRHGNLVATLNAAVRLPTDDMEHADFIARLSNINGSLGEATIGFPPGDLFGAQPERQRYLGQAKLELDDVMDGPPGDFLQTAPLTRVIKSDSIALADPVEATVLNVWYENAWEDFWQTHASDAYVTVKHNGLESSDYLPDDNEFWIAVIRTEGSKPSVEWGRHKTATVKTRASDSETWVRISKDYAPSATFSWAAYRATVYVDLHEREDDPALIAGDIQIEIVRCDGAAMAAAEMHDLVEVFDYSMSFMRGFPTESKIGLARKEPWPEPPVWAYWKAPRQRTGKPSKNWMPMDTPFETVLSEVVSNFTEKHQALIRRYLHAATADHHGDWMSAVTASFSVLQYLATEKLDQGGNVPDKIRRYLGDAGIDPHYHYRGWDEQGYRPHSRDAACGYPIQEIANLRNTITAHWDAKAPTPVNALWLESQALYYVEACLLAELAPSIPQWDRTRGFHHYPNSVGTPLE